MLVLFLNSTRRFACAFNRSFALFASSVAIPESGLMERRIVDQRFDFSHGFD